MHHPTDRIAHTTAFVTPVVEHWLEREIAQWVHPMKDRPDDPSHHERTLFTTELHLAPSFKRMTWTVNLHVAYTFIYIFLLIIVLPLIYLISDLLSLNCNYCIVLCTSCTLYIIFWVKWRIELKKTQLGTSLHINLSTGQVRSGQSV